MNIIALIEAKAQKSKKRSRTLYNRPTKNRNDIEGKYGLCGYQSLDCSNIHSSEDGEKRLSAKVNLLHISNEDDIES